MEKFAINSVISATHTSQMDAEDKKDIIDKIETAGNTDNEAPADNTDNELPADDAEANVGDVNQDDSSVEDANIEEAEKDNGFLIEPKRLSIFAPKGSKEYAETIKNKLQETFNQDSKMEPVVEPVVKPTPVTTPEPLKPSRKNRPFLPTPSVQPQPKAMSETNVEAKVEKVNTTAIASELASISKNVNDMISKQIEFFNNKKIDDAKEITTIISQAAELIKNR